jgi:WD40 repeat protein
MENWSRYLYWPGWSSDGLRFTAASDDHPEAIRVLTASGTQSATLTGHTAGVNAARWSPTANLIATGSWDGTLRLWSANGQLLRTIQLIEDGSVEGVGWSSDGERLAATCSNGSIHVLSPTTGVTLQKWLFDEEVFCPAWSPDGRTLATTMESGWAFIETDSSVRHRVHEKPGIEIAWRPDGVVAAVTCDDGNVWLDAGDANLQLLHSLDVPTLGASWHTSGLLAVGDDGGGVHVLDKAGHMLWHTQLEAEVIAVEWQPRSQQLLAATRAHGAYLLALEGMTGA